MSEHNANLFQVLFWMLYLPYLVTMIAYALVGQERTNE